MAPSRDRRPGFSRRAQYGLFAGYVLAIAGVVLGTALLLLSTFNPPAFAAARSAVAEVTTPVASVLAAFGRGVVAVPTTIGTYFQVHEDNVRLRATIARDRALVTRARVVALENRRMRALLRLRDRTETAVVVARLVSSTPTSTRRFALLNAGTWQGVREGQPVRGPEGLVGRVVETGPNTARVLLVTDPDSTVPVRRTRDGAPGIAVGRGDGQVDIRSADSADAGFRPGDMFVTSGTGGLYAPGTPVARVTAPGRDTAVSRPFARPDTLDFAIVTQAFMPPAPPPRRVEP